MLLVKGLHQNNDPQGGIQKCKTDTCLLYILNELGNVIFIIDIYDTLVIWDKPELMNTIEYIKK